MNEFENQHDPNKDSDPRQRDWQNALVVGGLVFSASLVTLKDALEVDAKYALPLAIIAGGIAWVCSWYSRKLGLGALALFVVVFLVVAAFYVPEAACRPHAVGTGKEGALTAGTLISSYSSNWRESLSACGDMNAVVSGSRITVSERTPTWAGVDELDRLLGSTIQIPERIATFDLHRETWTLELDPAPNGGTQTDVRNVDCFSDTGGKKDPIKALAWAPGDQAKLAAMFHRDNSSYVCIFTAEGETRGDPEKLPAQYDFIEITKDGGNLAYFDYIGNIPIP